MKLKDGYSGFFEIVALVALAVAFVSDLVRGTRFALTFLMFLLIAIAMLCLDLWGLARLWRLYGKSDKVHSSDDPGASSRSNVGRGERKVSFKRDGGQELHPRVNSGANHRIHEASVRKKEGGISIGLFEIAWTVAAAAAVIGDSCL